MKKTVTSLLGKATISTLFLMGSYTTLQAQSYCEPSYNVGCAVSSNGNIKNVKLTGEEGTAFNNTTDCTDNILGIIGGIGDYTNLEPVILNAGQTYHGSIETGSSIGDADKVKIWIDWDNDGVFDEDDEVDRINGFSFLSGSTASFSIDVPADAPGGEHRMRVRLVSGVSINSVDPCSTEDVGEVEDYTISVNPACEDPTIDGISVQENNGTYSFSPDNANEVESYEWDFGDGSTSSEMSPTHQYSEDGTYTVTLTISNDCGEKTVSTTVDYSSLGINELMASQLKVYPNPARDYFVVNNEGNYEITSIEIYNMLSQKIAQYTTAGQSEIIVETQHFENGVYLVQIHLTDGTVIQKKVEILQ